MVKLSLWLLPHALLLALLSRYAHGEDAAPLCACGYQDPTTGALWTDASITYFNESQDAASTVVWRPDSSPEVQGHGRAGDAGHDPTAAAAQWSAVSYVNPWEESFGATWRAAASLNNTFLDGRKGLALQVSPARLEERIVYGAAVVTRRRDILHGTFRAAISPQELGVSAGTTLRMALAYNDSSSVSATLVSTDKRSDARLDWASSSPDSKSSSFSQPLASIGQADAVREHRLDWLPLSTAWHVTSLNQSAQTRNVVARDRSDRPPRAAAPLALVHASNGEPTGSQGPPLSRAVTAHVLYARLFFNSSLPAREAEFERTCARASSAAVCSTEDVALRGSTPFSPEATKWILPTDRRRRCPGFAVVCEALSAVTFLCLLTHALVKRWRRGRRRNVQVDAGELARTCDAWPATLGCSAAHSGDDRGERADEEELDALVERWNAAELMAFDSDDAGEDEGQDGADGLGTFREADDGVEGSPRVGSLASFGASLAPGSEVVSTPVYVPPEYRFFTSQGASRSVRGVVPSPISLDARPRRTGAGAGWATASATARREPTALPVSAHTSDGDLSQTLLLPSVDPAAPTSSALRHLVEAEERLASRDPGPRSPLPPPPTPPGLRVSYALLATPSTCSSMADVPLRSSPGRPSLDQVGLRYVDAEALASRPRGLAHADDEGGSGGYCGNRDCEPAACKPTDSAGGLLLSSDTGSARAVVWDAELVGWEPRAQRRRSEQDESLAAAAAAAATTAAAVGAADHDDVVGPLARPSRAAGQERSAGVQKGWRSRVYGKPAPRREGELTKSGASRVEYLDGLRGYACFAVSFHHFMLMFYVGTTDAALPHHYPRFERWFGRILGPWLLNGGLNVGIFFVLAARVIANRWLMRGRLQDLAEATFRRVPRLLVPVTAAIVFSYFMLDVGGYYYVQRLASRSWSTWAYFHNYSNVGVFLNMWLELWFTIPPAVPLMLVTFATGILWTVPIIVHESWTVFTMALISKHMPDARRRYLFYSVCLLLSWYAEKYSMFFIAGLMLADADNLLHYRARARRGWTVGGIRLQGQLLAWPLFLAGAALAYIDFNLGENDHVLVDAEFGWHPDWETALDNARAGTKADYRAPSLLHALLVLGFFVLCDLCDAFRAFFQLRLWEVLGRNAFSLYLCHGIVFWSASAGIQLRLLEAGCEYWLATLVNFVVSYALLLVVCEAFTRTFDRWGTSGGEVVVKG